MPVDSLGKLMMVFGAMLFFFGLLFMVGGRFGLGNLPGDIGWQRGNTSISFPIVSSIVISLVLTIVLNLVLRFFR